MPAKEESSFHQDGKLLEKNNNMMSSKQNQVIPTIDYYFMSIKHVLSLVEIKIRGDAMYHC